MTCIGKELQIRKEYIQGQKINTIYFGGGTPSILNREELMKIFDIIYADHVVDPNVEITLEANPDDLSPVQLKELRQTPVNRLSIGIQSFREADLVLMNRSHNVRQAEFSVKASQDAGITNISVDLIYGIPGLSMDNWQRNLEHLIELNVPHFSAYCLTIEERTAFASFLKKGIMKPVPDELSSDQFLFMLDFVVKSGYEHYEVSNFSKSAFRSKHNSSYWSGEHYMGVGPSAHSFNGISRQWNISNNIQYVKALEQGTAYFESEMLSETNRLNEIIMTGLRTAEGINLSRIEKQFSIDLRAEHSFIIEKLIDEEKLIVEKDNIRLSPRGFLFADQIASGFFSLEKKTL